MENNRINLLKKNTLETINENYQHYLSKQRENPIRYRFLRTFVTIDFNKKDIGVMKEVVSIINNTQGQIFHAKIIVIPKGNVNETLWVKWNFYFQ